MLESQHVGRLKDNFWISNRAIFSVMKKEYAIMFGLSFAF